MRVYLRSLLVKKLHLEGTVSSFFKTEYFIACHEDTGSIFVSIQWHDFGGSLRKNVENFPVYLTL
jgi:hypothetical protein